MNLGVFGYIDRSSGRLMGPNSETGGAPDSKNLRVKVFNYIFSYSSFVDLNIER